MDWKSFLRQSVSTLATAADAAQKRAAEGLKHLASGKGFKGFIAAAALVIMADGKIQDSELDNSVRNIRAYPTFASYTDIEILTALKKQIAEVSGMPQGMAQRHLLGIVRASITEQSAQEVLVEFLLDLSMSDGSADPTEVAAIKALVSAFGLNESSFKNLAAASTGDLKAGAGAWS